MKWWHAAQVLSLAAVLAACGAEKRERDGDRGRRVDERRRVATCPVTLPDNPSGSHGDVTAIRIILPGSGKIVVVPRGAPVRGPHLVTDFLDRNGTIRIKFPVWTGSHTNRRLRIRGASLDGTGGRVRGEYAPGPSDFHPGYLVFPHDGCWRVTTASGRARVTFVVDVVDCVRRECPEV